MSNSILFDGVDRANLERRAAVVRTRLMHTIGELDRRRHEVFDVRLQVRRHLTIVAVASGVALLVVTGTVTLVAVRVARAPARRRRERWSAMGRILRHPERVARGREGVGPALVKKVVGGALAAAAAQLARALVSRLARGESSANGAQQQERMRVTFDAPSEGRALRLR